MENVKTHVVFPKDLLKSLDRLIGKRKRSRFVVEATREKIERLKFSKALDKAAGAWKDKNHPDLKTQEDVNKYLKKTRAKTSRRIARLK